MKEEDRREEGRRHATLIDGIACRSLFSSFLEDLPDGQYDFINSVMAVRIYFSFMKMRLSRENDFLKAVG